MKTRSALLVLSQAEAESLHIVVDRFHAVQREWDEALVATLEDHHWLVHFGRYVALFSPRCRHALGLGFFAHALLVLAAGLAVCVVEEVVPTSRESGERTTTIKKGIGSTLGTGWFGGIAADVLWKVSYCRGGWFRVQ